jgi:proteasome assembly chaperone (PAC2) family protein
MGNVDHVRWMGTPRLRAPVVIAAFSGWNDAGDAASGAVRALVEAWRAEALADIDPEEYTDFATIRPQVRLTDGVTRQIVWPTVGLWSAATPGGDVILVLGPEPSLRWRSFTDQIVGVAERFGASLVLTLGALLADVPHRGPVQLIGTATDQDVIDRYQLQRSRYEGPTGIVGVLHDACASSGLPSASLWAAVPAYAAQVPSPRAALELMSRACDLIGTPTPRTDLTAGVEEYLERVDALVAADDDLAGYVRRLELLHDDEDGDEGDDDEATELGPEQGEQLVEEVERFLRDQGDA